jgi:hypothetical protein
LAKEAAVEGYDRLQGRPRRAWLVGGGVGARASLLGSDSFAVNLQLRFSALSHIITADLEFSDGFRERYWDHLIILATFEPLRTAGETRWRCRIF